MRVSSFVFPLAGMQIGSLGQSLCLLAFLLATTVSAEIYNVPMESRSPVSIKVEVPFSVGPAGGHTELVVRINNGMKREGTWSLIIRSILGFGNNQTSFLTEADFVVPAGQEQSFIISVPILQYEHSGYLNLLGEFNGDYTEYSEISLDTFKYSHSKFSGGVLLLSPELFQKYGSALEATSERRGSDHIVSRYYPDRAPKDWRCYVGFDRLLMSRADWLALSKGAQKAILDAVATGELELRFYLPIFTPEISAELGIPSSAKVWQYGQGVISRHHEPMEETIEKLERGQIRTNGLLSISKTALTQDDRLELPRKGKNEGAVSADPLESLLEDKVTPSGWLSILMLGFGVLIGPVNFFVFARGRRCLRLFITTPIIAVAATVVLLLGILFFDGIGGAGHISRVIYLGEDDDQLYVVQEQVADTGLYFPEPFEIAGQDWLVYRGASIAQMDDLSRQGAFNRQSEKHSGDWFASKRLQAMGLKTYISSREGIDLVPQVDRQAPPKVFSNFRGICDVFYYVDHEKNAWKGQDLQLGGEQVLSKVSKEELLAWFRDQARAAGMHLKPGLLTYGVRPGHLYASVSYWQQEALETVSNIRWKVHTQLLIAPLDASASKGGVR